MIFGVGDFAQVAAVYLDHDSPFEVAAFTVHERYLASDELLGREVIAFEELERGIRPATPDARRDRLQPREPAAHRDQSRSASSAGTG